MKRLELKIEGMHCEGCAKRIENSLQKKEKIKSVNVSFKEKKAIVETELSKEELQSYIEDIGFQVIGE
jgi:Cu+-exporting ATPase